MASGKEKSQPEKLGSSLSGKGMMAVGQWETHRG
jgi:hypothetical protein